MALLRPQLEGYLLAKLHYGYSNTKPTNRNNLVSLRTKSQCSAIAIDAPSSLADVAGVRWGSATLQGAREEMEDDIALRSDGLDGFSFAAVFDGHGGFSSVKFLRDELYKECVSALQGGLLLSGKDFTAIRKALIDAFETVDAKLLNWLETTDEADESGSTATAMFIGNNMLIISHIGDSSVVLSRSGKPEVLTDSHRPYGSSKTSLQEIKRIREAGGWIVNGRICGDIAVSRAFGDVRFKTKKKEMLEKGVTEGRWSEKFSSRVQFNGDLVIASPDIYQIPLDSDAEFVLLASDGLWDYMKSSDAVSFVRDQLRQHGDVQLACEELAQAALDRRTQDNVSIIIADLGRTDWQALPIQQQNFVYELGQAFATIAIVSLGIWMSSQFPF
ncbi:Serine/threonine-protein phosphatase PP2A catalytic subunit [Turnera subulata]|uniref:protein-serine/threonine phosphatase n=1 Tax=Turnera subulata TaxID=218843 RepID=A0A9Q0G4M9_9ROSI|nr:Serine/threonine-protein phosphatase PP2A catalytic subunit [Turnera subulata]